MATNKCSASDAVELTLSNTNTEIRTNDNSVGERLKEAIYEDAKGKSSQKYSADRKANSTNRSSRRKLKQTLKKAIASDSISLLYPVCCGLDVHKDVIVACMRTVNEKGEKIEEIKEFSGFTDSKWLAELLQYGLLRGSFIPSKEVRDWRELIRIRKKLTKDVGDYERRAHKVFETANIKIDSVASDLFGVTGRSLMEYLCSSKEITLEGVEERAKGKLRKKG